MGKFGETSLFKRDYSNKIYTAWKNMRGRCNLQTSPDYKYYGGIGISYASEWEEYSSFEMWSVNNGYSKELTLDRINPKLNYSPDNCRWATRETQARNTRCARVDSKTGIKGVAKHSNKFRADIRVSNKRKYLGLYNTAEEAGYAYDKYVIENNLEHSRNYV